MENRKSIKKKQCLIDQAILDFGPTYLIFYNKTNLFFKKQIMNQEYYKNIFGALVGDYTENNNFEHKNLFFFSLFYNYLLDESAMKIYENHFKNNYKTGDKIDTNNLHLIYNRIEFEIKYGAKQPWEIKNLLENLLKFKELQKHEEDYFLFIYYNSILLFYLEKYSLSYTTSSNLILNMTKKISNEEVDKNCILKFIKISNYFLQTKILEKEELKSRKNELKDYLNSLFEEVKNCNLLFAIKVGIKSLELLDIYENIHEQIIILEKIYESIKVYILSKNNENNFNSYFYVSSFIGFYSCFLGDIGKIKKTIQRINRGLEFLIQNHKEYYIIQNLHKEEMINYYQFFLKIFTKFINVKCDSKVPLLNSFKERDDFLFDYYIIHPEDEGIVSIIKQKTEKYSSQIINTEPIDNNNLLFCYFYLYHKLVLLAKTQPMTDLINEDIKELSRSILNYSNQMIYRNNNLIFLFRLPYFKELYNKIYIMYLNSFYVEGNYNQVIEECDIYYDIIAVQYELDVSTKNYFDVYLLKGNALFKKKEYEKALEQYDLSLGNSDNEKNVLINKGFCYLGLSKIEDATTFFNIFKEKYSKYEDKIKIVNEALNNKLLFAK